jgi:putative ABC transport system permease protein
MRADGPRRYVVTQRTHEIGIRMALGALRSDVMGLVLGQSLTLTRSASPRAFGGAVATTRYLNTMLFGLTPLDPTTFVGASLTFAAVALIAAFVHARRATKVDPLVALRGD